MTGDSVFDEMLHPALAIHLSQSPFLNIFPEERAIETLRYMDRGHGGLSPILVQSPTTIGPSRWLA